MIDEEVSRIVTEQYERAKSILRQYAEGHNKLAEVLYTREVIFTEDVEKIFGKRRWTSRTDEILAAQQAAEKASAASETKEDASGNAGKSAVPGGIEIEATSVEITSPDAATESKRPTPPPSIPPVPGALKGKDDSGSTSEDPNSPESDSKTETDR